ncbi:30S ribosomal protein S19e [Natronocalculus amylovorans]|uniref:Small ribosomal subunit protein eS19 n=1 Tax=Natronocalculus amylovorans TaxID=2917812 RepID=A0AAE3FVV3_9EURY|nr:30S ribosomal protein S19e [Natronocalculus amylovorans]MCL9816532.1 30S ribosomal protein S19e [Natronocalculus amylovorans]NUE00978.1 30S ribosomal protein S19e [Halorubraceae archaeon YAN]
MVTLYDVPADELITELASRLADQLETPEWTEFTKSGSDRELPPQQDDFWEVRAASLLRKVALNGPIGIERLATEYGGPQKGSTRYRVSPSSHKGGSKKIIRTALAQLEEAGYVETAQGEGRRITDEGRAFLDEVAADVFESLDRPELERYA